MNSLRVNIQSCILPTLAPLTPRACEDKTKKSTVRPGDWITHDKYGNLLPLPQLPVLIRVKSQCPEHVIDIHESCPLAPGGPR